MLTRVPTTPEHGYSIFFANVLVQKVLSGRRPHSETPARRSVTHGAEDRRLNAEELALLDEQDPSTAGDGGFQRFIVGLQKRVRRGTSELILEDDDQEAIAHHAFDIGQGGFQTRLVKILGRTLGPNLGREVEEPVAD